MSYEGRRVERIEEQGGPSLFLIITGVVVAAIVIFIFQNTESAQVQFLFFDGSAKVWVVIVISVLAGMLLDRLIQFWMRRRRRREID
jgi:uncharacterized integral membrane protein